MSGYALSFWRLGHQCLFTCVLACLRVLACASCADTPEEVSTKVHTYAFSGGRATMKEHRERGADLEVRLGGAV